MTEDVPDHLRAELARFDEAIAELDTSIARANELPAPDIEPTDPEVLAQAAADPKAAPELRAVAAAVAAGRTSWAEVAAVGGATDLPEVRQLYSAGAQHVLRMLAEERAAAAAPRTVREQPDDEHDFSTDSIYDPS